jgi:hypothetical protein
MIVCEPVLAVVLAVAGDVMIVRDSPEHVKVVFIVRMEDFSRKARVIDPASLPDLSPARL